jgi:hypothetical protein
VYENKVLWSILVPKANEHIITQKEDLCLILLGC